MSIWQRLPRWLTDAVREVQYFFNHKLNVPYWLVYPVRSSRRWWRIRQFPVGTIVEDCRYHPCIVTEQDGGDLTVYSLITQQDGYGCSLFHCGIIKLNGLEVMQALEAYKRGGERELLKARGAYSDDELEERDRVWNQFQGTSNEKDAETSRGETSA